MQTYKNDINWWLREAHNDSRTATEIMEELGKRIVIVQEENEMLKAENIALKRAGNAKNLDELQKLKATIDSITHVISLRTPPLIPQYRTSSF